jgi:AraC-like DNA-binding protein
MQLRYKILDQHPENSFMARRETFPCLDEVWHYHKEYELIYFVRGNGVRYVGNTVERFDEGEIYFIGSNLPHLFKNDFYRESEEGLEGSVDMIIIQFSGDFTGNGFFDLPELRKIKALLQRSSIGLKFSTATSSLLHSNFMNIVKLKGMDGLIDLFRILNTLSQRGDSIPVCYHALAGVFRKKEKERIAKIRNFLIENYYRKIELNEVAALVNLTPTAFCRYFKRSTQKSLSEYLNEIRVGNACKMLIEDKKQISDISVSCGFHSPSNFNRRFKSVMGLSPTEYLKKYHQQSAAIKQRLPENF